jgi:hypothetical protein
VEEAPYKEDYCQFLMEVDALCLDHACQRVLLYLDSFITTSAWDYGVPPHVLSSMVEDSFNYHLYGLQPRPAEVYAGDLGLNFDFYAAMGAKAKP